MGLIGDVFQGLLGSGAAHHAASEQSDAARAAQSLEAQNQQQALDYQNQVLDSTRANEQPYLDLGSTAANALTRFIQTPFSAPTLEDVRNSPGYQFQLESGVNALDKSAAAAGNLFSGTQGTALERYATGLADSTYNDAYNRALQSYMTNFNTLFQPSQLGEQTATNLGQLGQAAASNVTGLNLRSSEDQAQQINNAAAARASGYVGGANAWNNAINNANSQLQEAAFMFA